MKQCRNCKHSHIGKTEINKTKHDYEMAKLGYRSCRLAVSREERATYHSGSHICDKWEEISGS